MARKKKELEKINSKIAEESHKKNLQSKNEELSTKLDQVLKKQDAINCTSWKQYFKCCR
jgi:hypothetical protein